MNLQINGEPVAIEISLVSVKTLLSARNVEMPDMVSVQLNGEFVSRPDFETTLLKEGDSVDFLYFMGGGRALSLFPKFIEGK